MRGRNEHRSKFHKSEYHSKWCLITGHWTQESLMKLFFLSYFPPANEQPPWCQQDAAMADKVWKAAPCGETSGNRSRDTVHSVHLRMATAKGQKPGAGEVWGKGPPALLVGLPVRTAVGTCGGASEENHHDQTPASLCQPEFRGGNQYPGIWTWVHLQDPSSQHGEQTSIHWWGSRKARAGMNAGHWVPSLPEHGQEQRGFCWWKEAVQKASTCACPTTEAERWISRR